MIELRAWEPDDTLTILRWVTEDPRMLKQMGFEDQTTMVTWLQAALGANNSRVLAATQDGEMVGYLAAVNCQDDGSGWCHVGVGPEFRGLGEDVMKAGLAAAFNGLGLKTLIASVSRDARGRAMERWDRKFGFKRPESRILVLMKKEWESDNGLS